MHYDINHVVSRQDYQGLTCYSEVPDTIQGQHQRIQYLILNTSNKVETLRHGKNVSKPRAECRDDVVISGIVTFQKLHEAGI